MYHPGSHQAGRNWRELVFVAVPLPALVCSPSNLNARQTKVFSRETLGKLRLQICELFHFCFQDRFKFSTFCCQRSKRWRILRKGKRTSVSVPRYGEFFGKGTGRCARAKYDLSSSTPLWDMVICPLLTNKWQRKHENTSATNSMFPVTPWVENSYKK